MKNINKIFVAVFSLALLMARLTMAQNPIHAGNIIDGTGGALLSGPHSVFVSGNYAYVASSNANALEILDISNPINPVHKGSLTDGTGGALLNLPWSVYVSGNYAYIVSMGSNALEIVDISNPAAPVHKGSITNGTGGALLLVPSAVYVSGNYAYVVGFSNALEIIDISNPTAPIHKGSITNGTGGALLQRPYSVFVSGNYAYVASTYSNALEIVDVSNPAAPIHKGNLVNNSITGTLLDNPISIYVSGNYAYIASVNNDALEIVDISNPAAPVHKASLTNGTGGALLDYPYSVYVSGNYAYVASVYSQALEIVNISDPAAPVHKGSITNGTGGALLANPQSVFVSGEYAYLASDNDAIEIISLTGVFAVTTVTNISLSPSVSTITGGNNQLFTANVLPSNAADKSVTWSISPGFVGYIASDGTYTPPTTFTGVVTITATSISNPSITGIAIATITPYVDVAGVSVTPSILTVSGGGNQLFTANILPANATDKSVIWSIFPSNSGTIAFDGTFTAGAYTGAVTITATSMPNSIVGIAKVFIDGIPFVGVTSFFISPSSSVLPQGNSQLMMVENLLPLNATDKTIYWSFEPGNMGSILNDGTFYASITSTGIVTITASSVSDPSVIAYATITITSPIAVTSISITGLSSLALGVNYNYTANILPFNVTDKNVTWTSSNTIVGIINSSGLFTGLSAGTTTITATSVSNPTVIDAILITVNPVSTTGGNNCNPVHAGSISDSTGGANLIYPNSVYISGNYAYVASSGGDALEIIDVSNPNLPFHKSKIIHNSSGPLLKTPTSVYVSGNYAYVVSQASNSLEIIDISNPVLPVHKGSLIDGAGGALLNYPKSVYVSGSYAYIASDLSNALEIVDISNPSAPIHKGSISNGMGGAILNHPTSVYISGDYAYVISYYGNTLEIIDVSDPATPVHKGSLTDGTGGAVLLGSYAVYISGNYAYVVSADAHTLEIIDVSNPSAPVHKGKLSNGTGGASLYNPLCVFVSGNYAYVGSVYTTTLEIIDVSNPSAPMHKGSLTDGEGGAILNGISSIYVSGNYAYICSQNTGALEIVSLSCNTTTSPGNYFISIVNNGAKTTIVNGNTIISWPTMTGVSSYCLQYSTDSTFATNVVTVCGLTSPSYTISGFGNAAGRTEGQTIYWKVGAVDDATGAVYWSDVQNTARVLQVAAPISVDQLQLYPNPSSDLIHISGLKTNDEVLIYDVHGYLVLKTKASSISISSLANGIYVARIGTKSLRFVKQ